MSAQACACTHTHTPKTVFYIQLMNKMCDYEFANVQISMTETHVIYPNFCLCMQCSSNRHDHMQ